jgi:hypothetical protein
MHYSRSKFLLFQASKVVEESNGQSQCGLETCQERGIARDSYIVTSVNPIFDLAKFI